MGQIHVRVFCLPGSVRLYVGRAQQPRYLQGINLVDVEILIPTRSISLSFSLENGRIRRALLPQLRASYRQSQVLPLLQLILDPVQVLLKAIDNEVSFDVSNRIGVRPVVCARQVLANTQIILCLILTQRQIALVDDIELARLYLVLEVVEHVDAVLQKIDVVAKMVFHPLYLVHLLPEEPQHARVSDEPHRYHRLIVNALLLGEILDQLGMNRAGLRLHRTSTHPFLSLAFGHLLSILVLLSDSGVVRCKHAFKK